MNTAKISCPLVKSTLPGIQSLPKFNGKALATLLAFGVGLMAAAISSGPF